MDFRCVEIKMRFFLCWWLVVVGRCAIFSKISTQAGNTLTASDYLVSTLGFFRMTLAPATCQLQIENFTNNAYAIAGYYPRTALPPCRSLAIANNSLASDNHDAILALQPAQMKTLFDEVLATIDEMGVIRINGVFSKRYESSENWISLFRTPRQFVYAISNLSVTVYSSLSFIQNAGSWGFSATNGELRLFRVDDVAKIVRYNYTSFTLTPNNLFDYNSNSLPQANYNEFRYYSTCSPSGYLENFQGPFVFAISPFWPELRLIDRNGYEVISLRYPSPHCLSLTATSALHHSDNCMTWFCPENTFQLNGDCLAACPLPYFHQLGKNGVNRCVINCQATLSRDSQRRVCACGQLPSATCPSSLKTVPLGCLCGKGAYYNPYNQLEDSASCTSTCGPFLFPHKDGICVPCPQNCELCQLSQNSFAYLACSRCENGFLPNAEGFCIRSCSDAQGNSTVCRNCTVANCDDCSELGCVACSRPYSLMNGSCLVQCPKGFKSQFDREKGFQCVLVTGCTAQSSLVASVNNQSSCFCTRNGNPSYSKACGSAQPSTCAFDSYFDGGTQECLGCPVGCLTCVLDRSGKVECTSCRPDYSLFVTVSKNHYCERNSILSICPNLYDPSSQICSIAALNQTLSALAARTLCIALLPRCLVCIAGGLDCSLCAAGWLLMGGKCVEACPKGTVAYQFQGVCVPIQRENCLREVTENAYWLFVKSRANQFADGYFYLISANFQAVDYLNDPLGSTFTLSSPKGPEAQRPRLVSIATSFQRCTLCNEGYGISGSGCRRCVSPCLQCTFYSEASPFCLRCDSEHRLANNTCVRLNLTELPCRDGEYRNEALLCQSDCLTFHQRNRSVMQGGRPYDINCTANCPLAVLPFHDSQGQLRLACNNVHEQQKRIVFLGSKLVLPSSTLYFLISSTPLAYAPEFSPQVMRISAGGRRLSESSEGVSAYAMQLGVVIRVEGDGGDAVVVRLPAAKLSGVQGDSYLSNSVYGFDPSSQSFMQRLLNSSSLYVYGRAYVVVALLLTLVFLAGGVAYKTDNLFATFSVLYLCLPSLNLRPESSAFSAYSFLYGFSWSSLLELLSNPRAFSQDTPWFDGYLQTSNSNAHYLLFVDSNIIRNGWSILLVLVTVGVPLALLALGMRCLAVRPSPSGTWRWSRVGFDWRDVDHSAQVRSFILFLVENSLMGLTYYSLLSVSSQSWQLASPGQQLPFRVIGGIVLFGVVVYCCLRGYASRVAGVYCLKRVLLGLALAVVSQCGGVDQNVALTLSLLISIELLFLLLRYRTEFLTHYLSSLCKHSRTMATLSRNKVKTRHTIAEGQKLPGMTTNGQMQGTGEGGAKGEGRAFWTMVGQEVLILVVYVFLVLLSWLGEASVVAIWGVLNVFMVSFGIDFVDLVVDYWDKWYGRRTLPDSPFSRRIRNNWDHELSGKSLSTTDL